MNSYLSDLENIVNDSVEASTKLIEELLLLLPIDE